MKLYAFLNEMLPERIPSTGQHEPTVLREDFIKDVMDGIAMAPMSIRLTPHIVSCIDVGHTCNYFKFTIVLSRSLLTPI